MRIRTLVALLLALGSRSAAADPKVALIDSTRIWSPTGIAVWAAARAKLDAEHPTFKVVELPPGAPKPSTPMPDLSGLDDEFRKQMQKIHDDADRAQLEDYAWDAHEHEVLDPIVVDVERSLQAFVKLRKIDLLLDSAKLEDAVLVVAAGVDLTDAFLADYNQHHAKPPATRAKGK